MDTNTLRAHHGRNTKPDTISTGRNFAYADGYAGENIAYKGANRGYAGENFAYMGTKNGYKGENFAKWGTSPAGANISYSITKIPDN